MGPQGGEVWKRQYGGLLVNGEMKHLSKLMRQSKSKNLWLGAFRHPWLSFITGFVILGSISLVIDACWFFANNPDDLDRGPHLEDDLWWAVLFGPVGGCIGLVTDYAIQPLLNSRRKRRSHDTSETSL
jgi:hypothetical protein